MPSIEERDWSTFHPRQERRIGLGNRSVSALLKRRKADTERGGGRVARYNKYHESDCFIVKTDKPSVSDKHSAREPNQEVREKVVVVIRNYGLVCIRPRV